MTYYWAGRAEEAIPQFQHALDLSPHGLAGRRAIIMLGWAQLALQDYDAAISSFRQGIARGSDWHWMYLTLASALAHRGEERAASEALADARRREPRVSLSWLRAGLVHQDEHYLEHFIDGLRKAGLQDESDVG
jgi:predicted Zn-dependent protease